VKQSVDYLIECSRTAREELLLRVRQRDSFLKTYFLIQVVLLAMSKGIKVEGVETGGPLPASLLLVVPVAVIFALLCYTEDRLIGQLSAYVGSLSKEVTNESKQVLAWDVSPQLRDSAKRTVCYRGLAHLAAFVITPSVLVGMRYYHTRPSNCWQWTGLALQVVLLIYLLFLSIVEWRYRMSTGQEFKYAGPRAAKTTTP
jgi:hypothetical protein